MAEKAEKALLIRIRRLEVTVEILQEDNQRLRELLQRVRELLQSLPRPQDDRGIPLVGAIKDGKVSWYGIDTPQKEE